MGVVESYNGVRLLLFLFTLPQLQHLSSSHKTWSFTIRLSTSESFPRLLSTLAHRAATSHPAGSSRVRGCHYSGYHPLFQTPSYKSIVTPKYMKLHIYFPALLWENVTKSIIARSRLFCSAQWIFILSACKGFTPSRGFCEGHKLSRQLPPFWKGWWWRLFRAGAWLLFAVTATHLTRLRGC